MSIIQSYRDEVKKLNAQNAALRKQRDELLAASELALHTLIFASGHVDNEDFVKVMMARDTINDAIAGVKGLK